MRRFAVPTAALLAVALSTGALAATTTATPAATKVTAASNPKSADCLKQWKAQKKHTQTRKAFMASCEKA
jgi:hypothetical protein